MRLKAHKLMPPLVVASLPTPLVRALSAPEQSITWPAPGLARNRAAAEPRESGALDVASNRPAPEGLGSWATSDSDKRGKLPILNQLLLELLAVTTSKMDSPTWRRMSVRRHSDRLDGNFRNPLKKKSAIAAIGSASRIA